MEKTTKSSQRIGIVGLGLIGGSLGLDLQSLGVEVYGLVHRSTTAEIAESRKLANLVSTNPTILADCDLIILALPLQQLLKPSAELIHALPKNAVITDVGSVKGPVLKIWRELHPRFIGSHPMAGTNNAGVNAGQKNLFKQRPWVSTPDQNSDPKALKSIQTLAKNLGCNWITTDAQLHDQAVALISHLPVLISAALLQTVVNVENSSLVNLAKTIASSGFEDTTRVGSGNPYLGTAMFENNASAILQSLDFYHHSIDQLEKNIRSQEWDEILKILKTNQLLRPEFLSK